jgi:hypothetical protein
LEFKLQNVSDELEASQERESHLNEALESKAPEIQIKVFLSLRLRCFKIYTDILSDTGAVPKRQVA